VHERRRIDRIMQEDYLDDLEARATDEIRAMRDECEEEESGVSYARRVLQGRLDILRAEAMRRRDEGNEVASSILERLPSILSDDQRAPVTQARVTRFLVPPNARYHRRDVERAGDPDALTNVTALSDAKLDELVADLSDRERELSANRRALLDCVDTLQTELARRYKSGSASVSEVLARRR